MVASAASQSHGLSFIGNGCTVAPEGVGGPGDSGAAAAATPQMQKIVGRFRRLLPLLPRPTDRQTELLPHRVRLWLGWGRAMDVEIACLRRFHHRSSFSALSSSLRSSSSLLSSLFFSLFSPPSGLDRFLPASVSSLTPAGPAHWRWRREQQNGRASIGNVTWDNSKLQCIMDTCTHTRSQSSYKYRGI